jgi:O-antigen/teichoic acid export membrane protein
MIMLPNLSQRSLHMIKNSAKQRALLLFAAGILLSLGYVLIAPVLFKIFFPNYIEGIFISQLYSLSFLFLPKMIYSISLYAQKMTRSLYISKISTPILKIILFLILTPTYGLIGAVISILMTLFIELFVLIILLHYSKKSS